MKSTVFTNCYAKRYINSEESCYKRQSDRSSPLTPRNLDLFLCVAYVRKIHLLKGVEGVNICRPMNIYESLGQCFERFRKVTQIRHPRLFTVI